MEAPVAISNAAFCRLNVVMCLGVGSVRTYSRCSLVMWAVLEQVFTGHVGGSEL